MQRTAFMVFFVVSITSLLGCGPDTGGRVSVYGTVTLHGAPLESGTIQFVGAEGSQFGGTTITAGKYVIPAEQGLLPGKYTVRVSAVKEAGIAEEAPGDSTTADALNQELVPAEFNVNSTITTDITAGSANTYDVAIP